MYLEQGTEERHTGHEDLWSRIEMPGAKRPYWCHCHGHTFEGVIGEKSLPSIVRLEERLDLLGGRNKLMRQSINQSINMATRSISTDWPMSLFFLHLPRYDVTTAGLCQGLWRTQ